MTQPLLEPFNFEGDLGPHSFRRFLKYCADQGVSDILVQGGDYIWAELHGRLRISLIVTGHFANNVTGFSTRLRGV